jgi:hypothetical protein
MKRFFYKICLFFPPILIVFLLPFLVLLLSGELFGIYKAVSKNVELFGLSYSYPIKFYKTTKTKLVSPDILILGSSRAMQFEEEFFDSTFSFYNAGGAINRLDNFEQFWKRLDNKPKYLIITVDAWWFNENYDNLKQNYFNVDFDKPANVGRVFLNTWKNVYEDMFSGKISLIEIISNRDKVGLLAIMQNEGFFNNGYYQYAENKVKLSVPDRMVSYVNQAKANEDRFKICTEINSEALEKFNKIVHNYSEEIGKENIFIIYPSMANTILDLLKKETHINYFSLEDSLSARMEKLGLVNNFYFSICENDTAMLDGIHPNPTFIKRDLLNLSKKDNLLHNILSKD